MSVTGTAATAQDIQIVIAIGDESAAGGGFLFPDTPNIVDFLTFLRNSVQIPSAALPGTSDWPQYALTQATAIVLSAPLGVLYTLAVYNCATHILYTITPDVAGQNYFSNARSNKGLGLIAPSTGLVAASSDETTSVTLASPDWAKRLTVGQLQMMKTPWGREYLAYAQSYGPSIVGLS